MRRIINTVLVLTHIICWIGISGIMGALETNSTISFSQSLPLVFIFLLISILTYFVQNTYNRGFRHEN